MNSLGSYQSQGLLIAKMRQHSPIFRGKRPLATSPSLVAPTPSSRRLGLVASYQQRCTTYLEIGVENGFTFQSVDMPFKWAVDPEPLFLSGRLPDGCRLFEGTSDEFFESLRPNISFDLVFLDGLHEWRQTYRDLVNSFNRLNMHGAVLIDDVWPSDEISAMPSLAASRSERARQGQDGGPWHGDVYKVLCAVHEHHPNISFRVIGNDTDNPQALLWIPESEYIPRHEIRAGADDYSQLDYSSVFTASGPPAWFRVGSEREVLDEFAARSPSGDR